MDQGRGEEWSRKDHGLCKMRKCWRKSLDKITVNRNDVHFWTAVLPNLCYPPNKFPKCYRNQTKTAGNGCFVLFRRESAKNRLKSLWYRLLFQGISPTIHGNVRHLKRHWKRQFFSFMEFFIHGMKPCHARFTIFLVSIAWMQAWRPNRWMTQDGSKRSVDIQGESFTSITGKERLGNLTFSFKSRNKPIHNNRLIEPTARFWPAKGQGYGIEDSIDFTGKNAPERNQWKQIKKKRPDSKMANGKAMSGNCTSSFKGKEEMEYRGPLITKIVSHPPTVRLLPEKR